MRQTLLWIPYSIGGVPLFGVGVLLALWTFLSVVWLVRAARRGEGRGEIVNSALVYLLVGAALVLLPRLFPEALPVRGYGVFLLLGVVAGVGLALHRARRVGVDPELILSLAVWLFIAGIVGARLFHVVEYWSKDYLKPTAEHPEFLATLLQIVNIPQGGLVVYGSLLGGAAALFAFAWRKRVSALALADLAAPSVLLGMALGRIGCLLNGCCFGGPCDLRWQVTFPPGSPPYQHQLLKGELTGISLYGGPGEPIVVQLITPDSLANQAGLRGDDQIVTIDGESPRTAIDALSLIVAASHRGEPARVEMADGRTLFLPPGSIAERSLPIHPTQIYSSINNFLLCALLLVAYPFRRREGEILALLATLYPISRFLLEIIRTDEAAVFGTNMSISQNVSVSILIVVSLFWVWLLRRPRGTLLPAVDPAERARWRLAPGS